MTSTSGRQRRTAAHARKLGACGARLPDLALFDVEDGAVEMLAEAAR
jgi:hypothetical protein